MSLSARAIALQGLGVGATALVIALQGLVPVDDSAPPTASDVVGGSTYAEFTEHLTAERRRIRRQNDLILMTVIAAVTGGVLQ